MPGESGGGPLGGPTNRRAVDSGTMACTESPIPGGASPSSDRRAFDLIVDLVHAEISNAGVIGAVDGAARVRYDSLARQYRDETYALVRDGRLTWREAAERAQGLRNDVMEIIRGRSTPVGRAWAEAIKSEGRTLNELIAKKTIEVFGEGADFTALSSSERNSVFAAIVESSGKSNAGITRALKGVSRTGRGLLLLSIGISIYNVATADDKVDAAKHEGAVTGAGIGGGAAGGALAGLACGPGAPVCVTIGAFVGGAAAAFGVDYYWSR